MQLQSMRDIQEMRQFCLYWNYLKTVKSSVPKFYCIVLNITLPRNICIDKQGR